jgi:HD-GYP domain-containing protein (c-di-GMP phosphodiesterase class II)
MSHLITIFLSIHLVLRAEQNSCVFFPKGDVLSSRDVDSFIKKYHQLYVPEEQREAYFKSLVKSEQFDDVEATKVIKDNAIGYLQNLFDDQKEFNTELLSETVEQCRDAVEGMIDVLDDYDIGSLQGLIGDLSAHDFYTYDHSINVSMYCISILRGIKPDATRQELLHAGLGGLLHDLGKVKIPTNILNSPGGLTDEEYEVIKKHPKYGIELLRSGECEVADDIDLETIARIVHEHHENWDGTGYPDKIKEKDIHFLARLCAIADFFDAVTTKRSYSDVMPVGKAMSIMENTAGKKLDPLLFKAFARHVNYSKIKSSKELKMGEKFDPSIPFAEFPMEEIDLFEKEKFGGIKVIDETGKKVEEKKDGSDD